MKRGIQNIKKWLIKSIPYLYHWKNILGISLLFGLFQVFIIIFLEPHGTDRYNADYKYLKLSGYALCYVVPFLMIYAFERQIFKMLGRQWNRLLEILFKLLLVLFINTANYFYNINIINTISPSFNRWLEYNLKYSLPNFFILLPLIGMVYFFLWNRNNKIVLKGFNRQDNFTLREDSFVYAVSDKNYVEIFCHAPMGTKSLRIRTTLKRLHEQLPFGIRVHKSFIINPNYIERVKGGKKDRFIILEHITKPIPVSREYDISQLI